MRILRAREYFPNSNVSKDLDGRARDFEAVLGHQFGIGHNLFGATVGGYAAVVNQDDPVRKLSGKIHVARGYDQRLRELS